MVCLFSGQEKPTHSLYTLYWKIWAGILHLCGGADRTSTTYRFLPRAHFCTGCGIVLHTTCNRARYTACLYLFQLTIFPHTPPACLYYSHTSLPLVPRFLCLRFPPTSCSSDGQLCMTCYYILPTTPVVPPVPHTCLRPVSHTRNTSLPFILFPTTLHLYLHTLPWFFFVTLCIQHPAYHHHLLVVCLDTTYIFPPLPHHLSFLLPTACYAFILPTSGRMYFLCLQHLPYYLQLFIQRVDLETLGREGSFHYAFGSLHYTRTA